MSNLLWKEWHEQRWKLAFGCLILSAFALIGLRARVVADEVVLSTACFIAVLMLPILAASGLVPMERAEGTLEMLISLPVRPWRIFFAKTVMGSGLCVVPILSTAVVSLAFAEGREMSAGSILEIHLRTLAAALLLFGWMLALTARLPNEARAGLLSVGMLVMALIPLVRLDHVRMLSPFYFTLAFQSHYSIASVVGYSPVNWTAEATAALAVFGCHLAVVAGLWFWAARRFAVED